MLLNVRDDTAEYLSITVTTYMPLSIDSSSAHQPQTVRLPLKVCPEKQRSNGLSVFEESMKHRTGMLENFHRVGGPQWKEWSAWG
jgi:hypothetical protein